MCLCVLRTAIWCDDIQVHIVCVKHASCIVRTCIAHNGTARAGIILSKGRAVWFETLQTRFQTTFHCDIIVGKVISAGHFTSRNNVRRGVRAAQWDVTKSKFKGDFVRLIVVVLDKKKKK